MNIKKAREKMNMSQEEVARKINMSLRAYIDMENGKSNKEIKRRLELCKLLKICPYKAFDIVEDCKDCDTCDKLKKP